MSETLTTAQPEIESMVAVRDELYQRLIDEHGYARIERSRIPGTIHGVVRDNIEVVGDALTYEKVLDALQHNESAFVFSKGKGTQKDLERIARSTMMVRVHVRAPVNAREDAFFKIAKRDETEFLTQKYLIVIQTRDKIQSAIKPIIEYTDRGSAILQLCRLPMHDYARRGLLELMGLHRLSELINHYDS